MRCRVGARAIETVAVYYMRKINESWILRIAMKTEMTGSTVMVCENHESEEMQIIRPGAGRLAERGLAR